MLDTSRPKKKIPCDNPMNFHYDDNGDVNNNNYEKGKRVKGKGEKPTKKGYTTENKYSLRK